MGRVGEGVTLDCRAWAGRRARGLRVTEPDAGDFWHEPLSCCMGELARPQPAKPGLIFHSSSTGEQVCTYRKTGQRL